MIWYEVIFIIYMVVVGVIQLGACVALIDDPRGTIECIPAAVNPVIIYRTEKVNWFGCLALTLLGNMLFPIFAICYWIYKLCTVGRK